MFASLYASFQSVLMLEKNNNFLSSVFYISFLLGMSINWNGEYQLGNIPPWLLCLAASSLYEKSLFVDLKLEASRGNVYCHQLFFAARVPAVWRLLQEIAKYQNCGRKPAQDLICIQLPDVEYKDLQKFTR